LKTFKLNELVEFANPHEDELGMTYSLREINGGRGIIEAACNMRIRPTQLCRIADLKSVDHPSQRPGNEAP
jgi:hypothetical protein